MESASQGPESNEFISADCLIAKSSFPTTTETPADSASLIHNDVTTTTTSESSLELSDSIDFVSLTQVGSDDVTLSQMEMQESGSVPLDEDAANTSTHVQVGTFVCRVPMS